MARNRTRAARRNAERRTKNQTARQAGAQAADNPTPALARTQQPLERYYARSQIGRQQYDAGTKLYEHWLGMGGHGSLTSAYGCATPGHEHESPYQIRCYREFRSALQAVGLLLSPVLIAVCIQDETARDWARRYNRSEADGIAILRLALDGLAIHYGYLRRERVVVDHAATAVVMGSPMLAEVPADAA